VILLSGGTRTELSLVRTAAAYLKISEEEFHDHPAHLKRCTSEWLLSVVALGAMILPDVKYPTINKLAGRIMVSPAECQYLCFQILWNMVLQINGHRINPEDPISGQQVP
jgi:hypothetical protein